MNRTKIAITIEVECYSETATLTAAKRAFPSARIETLGAALHQVVFHDAQHLEQYGFSNPNVTVERRQEFGEGPGDG